MDRVATPQSAQMPSHRRRRLAGRQMPSTMPWCWQRRCCRWGYTERRSASGLLADGRQVVGAGESVLGRGDALGLQDTSTWVHLILAVGLSGAAVAADLLASGIHPRSYQLAGPAEPDQRRRRCCRRRCRRSRSGPEPRRTGDGGVNGDLKQADCSLQSVAFAGR